MTRSMVMLATATLISGAALATPARAEIRTLFDSGLWSAYGGTDEGQRAVCGIATVGADGRRIAIQQLSGEADLELVLEKPSWAIPENTSIEVVVQVDGQSWRPDRSVGSTNQVRARVSFGVSIGFMRAVRTGQVVRVFFPSGTEPPWTGGLRGSSAAMNALNDCRAAFPPAAPTQPFPQGQPQPNTPPTQPFSPSATPPPRG